MLGNDVVDLRDPDADIATYRRGFDARVFGPAERAALAGSSDAAHTRWRFWAAKEAAYKALRQQDPAAGFSPVGFEVTIAPSGVAEVHARVAGAAFEVRFFDGEDHVHAVALPQTCTHEFDALLVGSARIEHAEPAAQSAGVRVRAAAALAARLGVAPERVTFEQRERRPHLRVAGRPVSAAVSFSHHGRHVAWAIGPVPVRAEFSQQNHAGLRATDERIAS